MFQVIPVILLSMLGIDIDQSWLNSKQPPYILSQPDTTYKLLVDVTVPETAFIDGAANVVLDLDQHTIKFGDSNPVELPNGGFENDKDGWDLTKAPTAVIKPAKIGMWGAKMLSIDNFTTPQILVSSAVPIPKANREYAATITGQGASGMPIFLEVIDTVTGAVLVSSDNGTPSRGNATWAQFTPTTVNPLKLQITITPPEGKAASVNLDYAAVMPSRDYGIIASRASTGVNNFPPHLKPFLVNNPKVANFKVRNGKIIQGKAKAFESDAVMGNSTAGLSFDSLSIYTNGMDAQGIEAVYSADVSVTNCFFDAGVDNISSRLRLFSQVKAWNNKGNVVVGNNVIKNCPQLGISINNNVGGTVAVTNNRIDQKAIVSNGYGIGVRGLNNFTITNNQIITSQGRGIILEAGGTPISANGLIADNYVDVREGPNLEYPQNTTVMDVQAFRVRNYDQTLTAIVVENNKFIATADAEGLHEAIGCRFTQDNDIGQMDNAHNIIRNNLFKAICTPADASFKASAISFSGVGPNTGVVFEGNTFESNSTAIQIGDWASPNSMNEDLTLTDSTIKKCDGAVKPFRFVYVGDTKSGCRNVRLLNTKFENGATDAVQFIQINRKELLFGSRSSVNPLLGQFLTVLDKDSKLLYTGDGSDIVIPLRTYTQAEQPAKVAMPVVITEQGPVTFKFEKIVP